MVGVCTLAHPASLPSALRLRWSHFGAEPGYEEVVEHVHVRLAPDYESEKNDRIFLVRRGRGFGDRPLDGEIWTYRSWWFSRGPRAPHAESRLRVGGVTVPLALIQAGDDELVHTSEGGELEALARQGDCPSVFLHTVLGADHVFTGMRRGADRLGHLLAGPAGLTQARPCRERAASMVSVRLGVGARARVGVDLEGASRPTAGA